MFCIQGFAYKFLPLVAYELKLLLLLLAQLSLVLSAMFVDEKKIFFPSCS